ncbi:biotin-protein ligase [Mycobacterium tuberculosis]|nr:biotin-protein ligase [Mycobacterium tuberculosis]
MVIGLGLNVARAPADVPGATSLVQLGVAPDRESLVVGLLRALGGRIAQWRGADPLLAADYRACSLTIGSRVRAQLPGGDEVVGTATGIDARGQLCLDTGGTPVVISAGDVVHLR